MQKWGLTSLSRHNQVAAKFNDMMRIVDQTEARQRPEYNLDTKLKQIDEERKLLLENLTITPSQDLISHQVQPVHKLQQPLKWCESAWMSLATSARTFINKSRRTKSGHSLKESGD